jgi:hypothetical protein
MSRQARTCKKHPVLSPAQRANLELLLLKIEIRARGKKKRVSLPA